MARHPDAPFRKATSGVSWAWAMPLLKRHAYVYFTLQLTLVFPLWQYPLLQGLTQLCTQLVFGSTVNKRPRKCKKHFSFWLILFQCIISLLQCTAYSWRQLIFLKGLPYLMNLLHTCSILVAKEKKNFRQLVMNAANKKLHPISSQTSDSFCDKKKDDWPLNKLIFNYILTKVNYYCITNISTYNCVFFLATEYGESRKLCVKIWHIYRHPIIICTLREYVNYA